MMSERTDDRLSGLAASSVAYGNPRGRGGYTGVRRGLPADIFREMLAGQGGAGGGEIGGGGPPEEPARRRGRRRGRGGGASRRAPRRPGGAPRKHRPPRGRRA